MFRKTQLFSFINVCIAIIVEFTSAFSQTNFVVKHLKLCPSRNEIKITELNVTNRNGKQYFDVNMIFPFPLDEDIGGILDIESTPDGNFFLPLFQIKEKYVCKAIHKYGGRFVYDLERNLQMTPGVCPIRAGHYYAHNFELEFNNIALQTFPFGLLRFTGRMFNKRNPKAFILCFTTLVENVYN